MTSQWPKTLTLLAVAAAMLTLVAITRPVSKPLVQRAEEGKPLTPDLTDPAAVTSLEVIGWDEASARPRGFKVAFENGKWVIPSAFNYPVDATANMAAAAASLVGLLKERVVTDLPTEHERLGVIAPDDSASAKTTGRGTRVTLRDASGKTMADLILGKAPEESDSPGAPSKRYVREAGRNRVYLTTLSNAFSTRFADWVQTDLLELPIPSITSIGIDRYTINERTGRLENAKSVTLTKTTPPAAPANPGSPPPPAWAFTSEPGGPLAPGQTLNQQKIDDLTAAINGLKIVGARPKSPNLVKAMSGAPGAESTITIMDQASLQQHGFYLMANGNLVANEGQESIHANDGVNYVLWFGELATDEATKDQSAGATPDAAKPTTPATPPKPADGRYLMVTVAFDEKAFGDKPKKPADLESLELAAAAATTANPLPEDQKKALDALTGNYAMQVNAFNTRVKTARDRFDKLNQRFSAWYYVVDAASLDKLRPTREDLINAPAAAPATPPPAPLGPTIIPSNGAPSPTPVPTPSN